MTGRALAAVRRTDAFIHLDEQVVRAVVDRRSRPIVAANADIVETANGVVAPTRTRIPDTFCFSINSSKVNSHF